MSVTSSPLAGSKLEAELAKPEVDGLIKEKLEGVMRGGDQRTGETALLLLLHALMLLWLCCCSGANLDDGQHGTWWNRRACWQSEAHLDRIRQGAGDAGMGFAANSLSLTVFRVMLLV